MLNTGYYTPKNTHLQQIAMMTVTITKIPVPTNTTTTTAAITNELIGRFEFHPVGLVLGVDNCCTEDLGADGVLGIVVDD